MVALQAGRPASLAREDSLPALLAACLLQACSPVLVGATAAVPALLLPEGLVRRAQRLRLLPLGVCPPLLPPLLPLQLP